jgi:hypothetical protein
MNTENNNFIIAAGAALAAFVLVLVVMYRARASKGQEESSSQGRVSDADRLAATERRRKEAELEKAVLAGTHLADGRPRCQASPTCMLPATHAKPRIARDESIVDFVRRQFGAPRRYRMIEPQVTPPEEPGLFMSLVGIVLGTLRDAWQGHPRAEHLREIPPLRYCEIHIPIAKQVCLEQLAADEHSDMIAQTDRERRIVHFEALGLEKRVTKIVTETEQNDTDKKRRPKTAEGDKSNVLSFGRVAGGGGATDVRPS